MIMAPVYSNLFKSSDSDLDEFYDSNIEDLDYSPLTESYMECELYLSNLRISEIQKEAVNHIKTLQESQNPIALKEGVIEGIINFFKGLIKMVGKFFKSIIDFFMGIWNKIAGRISEDKGTIEENKKKLERKFNKKYPQIVEDARESMEDTNTNTNINTNINTIAFPSTRLNCVASNPNKYAKDTGRLLHEFTESIKALVSEDDTVVINDFSNIKIGFLDYIYNIDSGKQKKFNVHDDAQYKELLNFDKELIMFVFGSVKSYNAEQDLYNIINFIENSNVADLLSGAKLFEDKTLIKQVKKKKATLQKELDRILKELETASPEEADKLQNQVNTQESNIKKYQMLLQKNMKFATKLNKQVVGDIQNMQKTLTKYNGVYYTLLNSNNNNTSY